MAREFGKINLSIWQDADWRNLPAPAQHLYLALWTHPSLNYCGVVDWRPARLTALADGWPAHEIELTAQCLEARHFLVIDHETEEALIRSYVRFDGLMKQPRVAVSFANAYASTASSTIRGVVIHEARKLRDMEPDLGGWEKPQVQELLKLPATDPRDLDVPEDPFSSGFGGWFPSDLGPVSPRFGGNREEGLGPVSGSPTTATATSTSLQRHTPRKNGASPAVAGGEFDAFWDAYGKKVGRGAAIKAWTKALKKADVDTLIGAAMEHADWHRRSGTDPRFIPHATTWLNEERWSDERGTVAQQRRADGDIDWDAAFARAQERDERSAQ